MRCGAVREYGAELESEPSELINSKLIVSGLFNRRADCWVEDRWLEHEDVFINVERFSVQDELMKQPGHVRSMVMNESERGRYMIIHSCNAVWNCGCVGACMHVES